jgi:transcriptional regulator with XRE-family HTH domain
MGLGQRGFADMLGVSENYIYMILNGKRTNVSKSIASLIEAKMGFCTRWILTGEGEPRKIDVIEQKEIIVQEIEEDLKKMDAVEAGDLAYIAGKILRERGEGN